MGELNNNLPNTESLKLEVLSKDNLTYLIGKLIEALNEKNKEQVALIYTQIKANEYSINDLNKSKLDNSGDVIFNGNLNTAGNLTVGGDLTVKGKTTTVNTETLKVNDNFILLNSDNLNQGTSLSGIAIGSGKDADGNTIYYGIAYDPGNESVSLGQGTIIDDDNNDFIFKEGERKPILTRSDDSELTNGDLLIWDSTQRKAVSGGNYNLKEFNDIREAISSVEQGIDNGDFPYDRGWMLSFEPEKNTDGALIGYRPVFINIDDGELN